MKTKLFLTALVVMFALSANTGFTQGKRHGDNFDGPCKGLHAIPDLSADQMKQMQSLKLEHQKEVLPVRTKLQAQRLDLKTLIMEEASQGKIDKKIEDIGAIQTKLMKMKIKHRLSVRNLLTDEQKVYFDSHGMRKMGGRGKDHGPQHPRMDHRGMRGERW